MWCDMVVVVVVVVVAVTGCEIKSGVTLLCTLHRYHIQDEVVIPSQRKHAAE